MGDFRKKKTYPTTDFERKSLARKYLGKNNLHSKKSLMAYNNGKNRTPF